MITQHIIAVLLLMVSSYNIDCSDGNLIIFACISSCDYYASIASFRLLVLIHIYPIDVEVNGELENGDNLISDHRVVVDPDQLIGPQVIDMIINKPGTYDKMV